jgi:CDP-glycerol glycerophosphotransferase (TagB/SpsB family)
MNNKNKYQPLEKSFSIKRVIKNIISIILSPLKYMFPKKYIIFSGTNNYIYNGNSRYLFEYLSHKSSYKVYWFTRSKKVKKYLSKNNLNYLSYLNPIKLIIISSMAKIVINDGDDYLNIFGLSDTKKTYKISLFHGYGPKTVLVPPSSNSKSKDLRIDRINKFDFVNFTSDHLADNVSHEVFGLPKNKVVILGFPRNDNFYDHHLTSKAINTKPVLKSLFKDKVDQQSKTILYTPTWRPYSYDLPIILSGGFDKHRFNNFLKSKNIFFVYTTHSAHRPDAYLHDASNIKYIDESFCLYDTNEMMLETDILLNDYSTTSVEFSILKRPQLFCIPDYEFYKQKKGFIDDYINTMPGACFNDMSDFFTLVSEVLDNHQSYVKKFEKQREVLLDKYYNLPNVKSMEVYNNFLGNLLDDNREK